jgi:hypothetical protein
MRGASLLILKLEWAFRRHDEGNNDTSAYVERIVPSMKKNNTC